MIRYFKEFMSFSRTERRGVMVLILVLMAVISLKYFVPAYSTGMPIDEDEFYARADSFLNTIKEVQEVPLQNNFKRPEKQKRSYISIYDTLMINLNRADTLDLQLLRGIGPWFAKNIVNYRMSLGGFVNVHQLLEVFGMDSARFAGVADNVSVDTSSIQKIKLNEVSMKQMLRHPYLDYHVVKAILVYRAEKGKIHSINELQELDVIYDELFEQIAPYLEVN